MVSGLGRLVDAWAGWVSAPSVVSWGSHSSSMRNYWPHFSDKVTPKFEGTHQRSHNQWMGTPWLSPNLIPKYKSCLDEQKPIVFFFSPNIEQLEDLSSLTRDQSQCALHGEWEHRVLTTGPPGKPHRVSLDGEGSLEMDMHVYLGDIVWSNSSLRWWSKLVYSSLSQFTRRWQSLIIPRK